MKRRVSELQNSKKGLNKEDEFEEKEDYKKLMKKGIIKFDHPLRENWDIFIILLTVYNCIELPLHAAFADYKDKGGLSDAINLLIDMINAIDIVLNFRTTFLNKLTGQEVTQPKEISRAYLRSSFIIDLMATIPFDLLF